METRIFSVFLNFRLSGALMLAVLATGVHGAVNAQQREAQSQPEVLIEPELNRREIRESDIDTEDFEVTGFFGIQTIEDFEQDTVAGARLAYHVTENIFVEGSYGKATAGQTSFEVLSGGAPFLTEDERDFTFYDVSFGYNFNGEVFVTDGLVWNSDFYLTLGGGSTDFGGDDRFTISIGGGYRLLLTDYLSVRMDIRDQIFKSELIGQEKDTHNLSYTLGVSVFF